MLGLSHEAVIEISIALLGVMITVLTLIAGLFAVVVALGGFFGYQVIRDEAIKRAEKISARVAHRTATKVARAVKRQLAEEAQASGLSEGQAEPSALTEHPLASQTPKPKRRRATNDSVLKKGGEE